MRLLQNNINAAIQREEARCGEARAGLSPKFVSMPTPMNLLQNIRQVGMLFKLALSVGHYLCLWGTFSVCKTLSLSAKHHLCLKSTISVCGALSLSVKHYLCLQNTISVCGALSLSVKHYLCLQTTISVCKPLSLSANHYLCKKKHIKRAINFRVNCIT